MVRQAKETVRLYVGPGDGELITTDVDMPAFEIIYAALRMSDD